MLILLHFLFIRKEEKPNNINERGVKSDRLLGRDPQENVVPLLRSGARPTGKGGVGGKTEHRTRVKAQIVLMAADDAATRAIGRALGCTTGTASKWRVRYAKDRLAGFSETGNRGAKVRYGIEADRRILALLDTAQAHTLPSTWHASSKSRL